MLIFAAFLLCQDPTADIHRLVRDLGHELIEVRERAHRQLLDRGELALPALQKAAFSEDAEIRHRAELICEVVGRASRERAHDADQKAALILLRRDAEAERKPGSGATEGARFDLKATAFDDGWVLSTDSTNYLARRHDLGPGRGELTFDVEGIAGLDGKKAEVRRCGRCSPAKVYVKGAVGPLRVRLTGHQVWFTPYHLEFQNPLEGQWKRVGDFRIQVAGVDLNVTSESAFPESWISSMGGPFEFQLKEKIGLSSGGFGRSIG